MKHFKESAIENKVAAYAKSRGAITSKFRITGTAGAPDRIFLLPGGIAVFIEFKKPGEVPTPAQREQLTRLRAMGFYAAWTDNAEGGIQTLRELLDNENPRFLIPFLKWDGGNP